MAFFILLLFIALPIAEIAVLIKVADFIDLWPTIMLIIVTAIVGVYLLRLQGLNSLTRAQNALNEGRLPVESITDAVALMLSGAFLLTPGLITDSVGFALLIPAVRHGLAGFIYNRMMQSSRVKVDIFGESSMGGDPFDPFGAGPTKQGPSGRGPIIEGEIIEPEEDDRSKSGENSVPRSSNKPSPWRRT